MSGPPLATRDSHFANDSILELDSRSWIVSQLGAREHFAIPRALLAAGRLDRLITDVWCPPSSWLRKVGALDRWHDRYHGDLADAAVKAWPASFVREELSARRKRLRGWDRIRHRNQWFQNRVAIELQRIADSDRRFFSYSYTASRLLPLCRDRGWTNVIGQIDPGPEEERIVAAEHERYSHVTSSWRPAPTAYWDDWRGEVETADQIVVNSPWSAQCLATEGIEEAKVRVIPLVFQTARHGTDIHPIPRNQESLDVLFLGQINLRKGIGRLIDAMRLLKDDSRIQLTLAGPTEVDTSLWADLPHVSWIGPLRRSEVMDIYGQSDVFILPTLSDGYALTQLEALAAGVPVIASRRCGEAVTHGENGWLLKDLEPASIAAAMVHACEQRDELKWGNASRTFGIEQLAERLIKI
ncbi:glycosyltransferase family 4 protein [Rhodopirellula bahusiensis]|uniref:Glycosyltransferase n=1 Tax=Rhodopirellula bahusiensis TaxID=2014065 RepID=A0A2G1WCK8_9BACT|nr:glycosyltransferase family 4 protein [Rhodopirellula bahusiensis]PHQ36736.1 glycosyltransferase [Rhodopirellula bahusiensis]